MEKGREDLISMKLLYQSCIVNRFCVTYVVAAFGIVQKPFLFM